MADLAFDEVAAIGRAVGLPIGDDDLVEVTHRLNVLLSVMAIISHPDLDVVVPTPYLPLEETEYGQRTTHRRDSD